MANIIFFGTPNFAVPILDKLIETQHKILTVITKPPKKSNRGQKINKSPVQIFAEKKKLDIKHPKKIEDILSYLNNLNFDIAIVVAYGQIIPENIINLCKYGFINIHASILPKYRGAAPIQRAIISRDQFTGISFMKMSNKLDSGPIFNQYTIQIEEKDNYITLSEKLSRLGEDKINENIDLILHNKAVFKEQDHKNATYAHKINKFESKINWNEDAKKILGKINGLYPKPGAWFKFKNERYKILKSKMSDLNGKPGYVLDEYLTVSCGKKSIRIEELQRQGKRPQKTKEFLLGNRIKQGSKLQGD